MTTSGTQHDPFVLLQRVHRWRMAFLSVVILMAGTVIGGGAMFLWQRRHPARARGLTASKPIGAAAQTGAGATAPWTTMGNRLDRHLDLTPEQHQRLVAVIRQHWTQLNRIKQEARPRIQEVLRAMNEEVSALLDDRQRPRWRQSFRQLQQQFQLDYRPGAPETQARKPGSSKSKDTAASRKEAAAGRSANSPRTPAVKPESPPRRSPRVRTRTNTTDPNRPAARRSDTKPQRP